MVFLCTGAAQASAPPKKIVSLAPGMTEILYAVGLGENIAAVTTFCDYPEEAKKKKKIGGMSNPSLEAVVALKPDVVVMTTDGNPKEFQERLASFRIKTFVFTARTLDELPSGIRELGTALNVRDRAEKLAVEIEAGVRRFQRGQSSMDRRLKTLFIVWPEPLIAAGPGTVMHEALGIFGTNNIAGSALTAYPKYSLEEILRQAPDVIFIGRAMGMDMRSLSKGMLKRMTSVPAVRNNRVYFVSDKLYRLGPRVMQGIEEMGECLE